MPKYDDAISPATIAMMYEKAPILKEMIGDVTTSIVHICNNEIAMGTSPDNGTIGQKGSQEILDYITNLMNEKGNDPSFNLSIDYGIGILSECISLVKMMRKDIGMSKLNVKRCKYFIRTSQSCINYLDAYAKAS